jgi:hypothetical protein
MAEPWDAQKWSNFTQLPTAEITTAPPEGKFWEKQDFIFMAIDVQMEHFWFLIIAFSKAGEFMVLDAGKLYTWQDLRAKQQEYNIPDQNVSCDCKYRTTEVYANCVRFGHVERHEGPQVLVLLESARGHRRNRVRLFFQKEQAAHPVALLMASRSPGIRASAGVKMTHLWKELAGRKCPVIRWSNPTIKDVAKNSRKFLEKETRGFMRKGPGMMNSPSSFTARQKNRW